MCKTLQINRVGLPEARVCVGGVGSWGEGDGLAKGENREESR